MNIAEQIRLKLQLKENSEVEFKSAAGGFPKAEFWRSFSALANTNGGTIVLGVKEKNHKFTAQPTNPVEYVQSLTQKHVAKRYMIGEKFLPLRHES